MKVHFREVDPFNCWLWFRFPDIPSEGERNYLDGVLDSWYVIGRMGGFNSANLQVNEANSDLNQFNYDNDHSESVIPALMHNIGHLEYDGKWARCWIDFGTSDSIAIDILINTLLQLDSDIVQLEEMYVGGVNDDWAVETHPDSIF